MLGLRRQRAIVSLVSRQRSNTSTTAIDCNNPLQRSKSFKVMERLKWKDSQAKTDRKLAEATQRETRLNEFFEIMRKRVDEEKQNAKLLARENSELRHQLVLAKEARTVSVNSVVELQKQLADLTLAADDAHEFKRKIVEAFKCCMPKILCC